MSDPAHGTNDCVGANHPPLRDGAVVVAVNQVRGLQLGHAAGV